MLRTWLQTFAHDNKVHVALILVAADLILGVIAAFKAGNFRFSYLADFLRNDILFKLLPYFAMYVLALVSGGVDIVIPGLDFGFLAGAAYATLVAAIGASILNSVYELKIIPKKPQALALAVAGSENSAPPKD